MVEDIARDSRQQDILQDDFMEISAQTAGYGAYYDIAGGDLFFLGHGPIRELQIGETNVGQAVDYFAKSFYSFIMADLGQISSPNVLVGPEILSKFWTACDSAIDHGNDNTFAPTGSLPANTFETLQQTTGPITISNATLNAQYLCQIPQRKDTASIVIAVIVADLVLLQAAWKVFTWITTFWVEKNPEAKFCAGCAKHLASSVVTNYGADGLAGSYEMFRGGVVGWGATQYAKLPHVQVGDVGEDNIR